MWRTDAPISLPNTTFRAWKLLSTYFVISATAIGTRNRGPPSPSYKLITCGPLRSSLSPTTVFGGFSKSHTLLPSRRYSGLTQTPKSTPTTLARRPLQCRDQHLLARTGDHRAPENDDVPTVLVGESGADLFARPFEILSRQPAAGSRRCADTYERDVRRQHRRRRILGDRQPSAGDHLLGELADPLLDDWRFALAQEFGLLRVDVDADDAVPPGCQARR